eukprot:3132933-Alexandrium_andersonii.AAC.1
MGPLQTAFRGCGGGEQSKHRWRKNNNEKRGGKHREVPETASGRMPRQGTFDIVQRFFCILPK